MTPSKTEHELEELLRDEIGVHMATGPDDVIDAMCNCGEWSEGDKVSWSEHVMAELLKGDALPALLAERKRPLDLLREWLTWAEEEAPTSDQEKVEWIVDGDILVDRTRSLLQEGSAGSALAEQEATDEQRAATPEEEQGIGKPRHSGPPYNDEGIPM